MRRKCWRGIQQYNPLLRKGGAVGRVYELPKKRGVPPPLWFDALLPSPKGSVSNMVLKVYVKGRKNYQLSLVSATQEEKGFLLTPLCLIHFLVERDEMLNCCSRR